MDGSTAWPSKSAGEVSMTRGNGFVVVSWWRNADSVPPYSGEYQYECFDSLNDAYEAHRQYEAGEFSRATAMGIFATKNGMPIGGRIV